MFSHELPAVELTKRAYRVFNRFRSVSRVCDGRLSVFNHWLPAVEQNNTITVNFMSQTYFGTIAVQYNYNIYIKVTTQIYVN